MTTYQGPHASVIQEFVPTPGAIAIENLPSVCVGTAFDVYAKEVLGSSYGIIDNELLWTPIENVVYDKSVIDQRAYDFYPVVVYAETPFGDIELEMGSSDVAVTGVTVGYDDAYKVPGTEQVAGACEGKIPFYKQDGSAGDVRIEAGDLSTIIIDGGYVVTAGIKPGQRVYVNISSTWTFVGVVGAAGNDETRVKLAAPYSAAIPSLGEGIVIGAASDALETIPDTLFDPNADFITARVRVGDVVKVSTLTVPASIDTPLEATIAAIINKNTLRFNTTALTAGLQDSDFLKYKRFSTEPGNSLSLYTYWIERFVGFSQNYKMKLDGATPGNGVPIVKVNETTLTYLKTETDIVLKVNDLFVLTVGNQVTGTDDRTVAENISRITAVVDGVTFWTVITDTAILNVAGSGLSTGEFIAAWTPKLETDVKVDFRSIREEEQGVVKRIASIKDITDAWTRDGEIRVHNELAFMASIMFGLNGGTVFYGGNVDASAANISAEYSEILEALKIKNVYSHAFGTTDAGVNAIVGPYCDNQADPYEGHERIAVLCYDEDDIYLMGTDGCVVEEDDSVITIDGVFDTLGAGLTVGDIAQIYDASGDLVDTVTVVETPDPGTPNAVTTDYAGVDLDDTHSVKFLSGRKDDQALKIAAINYGNRRIATVWPGWFSADFSGDRYTLPPYYITAAIAAMDSSIGVAQSFTNMNFSIPGLSNMSLNTNHYFKKLELDEIGAGGIDIMIQDATISQSIKSRHDLTSNMDAILYRERSITKQADVAAKTIRASIAPYVGRYNITDDLLMFIGQVLSVVITKLLKEGVLYALKVTDIARDEVIADKVNIIMEATVFVAGNYYEVTLIVKSS